MRRFVGIRGRVLRRCAQLQGRTRQPGMFLLCVHSQCLVVDPLRSMVLPMALQATSALAWLSIMPPAGRRPTYAWRSPASTPVGAAARCHGTTMLLMSVSFMKL